jgi:1,5-anhydro-D-fructose reductase (1,5-anhydro-D-mannitol-forming)
MELLRFALLGCWHVHAKDYAEEAQAHPDLDLVTIWDPDPAAARSFAAKYQIQLAEDLPSLLARSDIDGVIVATATCDHEAVITAAAEAGKHVFTENVIAARHADALRIVERCRTAGIKLGVSLPRLYEPYTLTISALLAEGRLGRITNARVRLSHEGVLPSAKHPTGWLPQSFRSVKEAQGGTLIDYGVHPLYLLSTFLGEPTAVQSRFSFLLSEEVEDSAVVMLEYPGDAIGVAESGLVNPDRYFSIEVHGTEGLLAYGTLTRGKLLLSAGAHGENGDWREVELQPPGSSPLSLWATAIRQGSDEDLARLEENVATALTLSAVVEAAYRSATTGERVEVAELRQP